MGPFTPKPRAELPTWVNVILMTLCLAGLAYGLVICSWSLAWWAFRKRK